MSGDPAINHLLKRVAELEERVAQLEQGGAVGGGAVTDPSAPSAFVRELVTSGNTIQAINEYRKETGVGLKEAKRRIEALA